MTLRLPVFTLLALAAIAACERADEAAGVPEEALSPMTEIEIADPDEVRQDVVGSIGNILVEAREAPSTADVEAAVVLSLLDDGTVMLNGEEVAPAELTTALEKMETPDGVTVKAERDVTVGTVDEVQKALVAAGITNVRFLTSR